MRRAQDRARSARPRKNGARSATIESRALGALKLASEASCAQSARWERARKAGRFFPIASYQILKSDVILINHRSFFQEKDSLQLYRSYFFNVPKRILKSCLFYSCWVYYCTFKIIENINILISTREKSTFVKKPAFQEKKKTQSVTILLQLIQKRITGITYG